MIPSRIWELKYKSDNENIYMTRHRSIKDVVKIVDDILNNYKLKPIGSFVITKSPKQEMVSKTFVIKYDIPSLFIQIKKRTKGDIDVDWFKAMTNWIII